MSSNHLTLYCPLLLPSVFSSIRVFSGKSTLCIRWPKYRSFSFIISILPPSGQLLWALAKIGLGLHSLLDLSLSSQSCSLPFNESWSLEYSCTGYSEFPSRGPNLQYGSSTGRRNIFGSHFFQRKDQSSWHFCKGTMQMKPPLQRCYNPSKKCNRLWERLFKSKVICPHS